MRKMTGPVNVKKISTLNVKSGRSGKCEKIYAKCEVVGPVGLNVNKIYAKCEKIVWSVA